MSKETRLPLGIAHNSMKTGRLSLYVCAVVNLLAHDLVAGTAVDGDLFYTRFADAPNVKAVHFSYDGSTTFTLNAPTVIGTTPGADGITGNPQNSNLLIIGNQGGAISTINKLNGSVNTVASPVAVYHVAIPDSTTALGSGIPGSLARFEINPGGLLSPGVTITLGGNDTVVTTIISTPSGFYYTSSGAGGFGSFGTLTFNNADVGLATTATTTRLLSTVASAHGATYDPFTGDIILFGDGNIGQYDIGSATLTERGFAGETFDQGAVDGQGHMFVASNGGDLLFMDYSASSSIVSGGGNFAVTRFLDTSLDDVAPLIGSGGTRNVPDSGTSALLLGLAFLSLAALKRGLFGFSFASRGGLN
jgi:hypothetical protein